MERPRLDERIPERGFKSDDEAMEAFVDWVADCGLSLYPHQEEAILEIFAGNHVVLDSPTGSGKSLVALALHFRSFARGEYTVYTAPIKALVNEKFFDLCEIFGPEHVGLLTGDGAVNRDAPILCCTAEILANMALREGTGARADSAVMDEFHYYADQDRGMAWQIPLLILRNTTFLLMSATLGDTSRIREDLELRTDRPAVAVTSAQRPVPLRYEYSTTAIHTTLHRLVTQGRAPVYVVHFAQKAATDQAQALMSVDLSTKEEKVALARALKGERFDSPFGPTLLRYLRHGVGLHHAGLLPRHRRLVERLAQQGLLRVVCGTDTLGVGINVPIRTVLFTQLCRFDGRDTVLLSRRDFKQIAGRAGRAGFDAEGWVVAQAPEHVIANLAIDASIKEGKKKKVVKKQPPAKGYKHWDEEIFQQLIDRPPEPLCSRFTVDHGRLLTAMQYAEEVHGDAGKGYRDLLALIEDSHASRKEREALAEHARTLLGALERSGVVQRSGDGERMLLDPDLQHDFSLHHSLSMWLLSALTELDPASGTYALDVISLTEAILEDPRPVLYRQVDRVKGQLVAHLKADGVPYEERMELLEQVSWPKPLAEWIYARFNAYTEHHPWVSGEAIRPKSVVRDMVEQYASFTDYIRDLGIERAEGVLLRYLTEAYKALVQNVPAEARDDVLVDMLAFVRAMLARVDSSLVTEWEAMLSGGDSPQAAPRPVDISEDRRSFSARVRAELHALLRALARCDWEEAAACTADDWTPDDMREALGPYQEAHGDVVFDHRARLGSNTVLHKVGPHQWNFSQVLIDADGEPTGAVDGQIDLRDDTNPDGPVIRLLAVTA